MTSDKMPDDYKFYTSEYKQLPPSNPAILRLEQRIKELEAKLKAAEGLRVSLELMFSLNIDPPLGWAGTDRQIAFHRAKQAIKSYDSVEG